MLQIDYVYEFLFQELFKNFELWYHPKGVIATENIDNIAFDTVRIFTPDGSIEKKIFFYDQEPLIPNLSEEYVKMFKSPWGYDLEEFYQLTLENKAPYKFQPPSYEDHLKNLANPNRALKQPNILATSEKSKLFNYYLEHYEMKGLYYFFHGFAALDWYRGHYALNYNKTLVKQYNYDFISFNRIINNDRSYRIYFVSLLEEQGLLEKGLVSFNVTDNLFDDWRDEVADPDSKLSERAKQHAEQHLTRIDKLIIDRAELPGSASADIPRNINGWFSSDYPQPTDVDAFWHIVTETVFYYPKLHLTEKIFKPIVSKQPFMLLAAPGNLAYLRSYGFKTFDGIIDESYDLIEDNDLRTEAVVKQLHWYCNLTQAEKDSIIQQLEPVIQHNFDHFYGEFKHIITRELIDNAKTLFKEIGYDDSNIAYDIIYKVLTA
jgi:hypothetical protein